jgi:NAD(P)H-hydrate repair Nnr-like enzyme with NAD(P)H-hydrate dehydratase domain
LSGLIGSALGQGIEPLAAAAVGCQVMGDAADLAARRVTARSMRPMDVVQALPDVWRRYELLRRPPAPPVGPVLLELPRPASV